ncbi:hypothetical protein SH668x_003084 [Planctomicrobium sp. SH668]|uniref:hypothetical protein n=1 Tax=Planctomicrobium sp. SH668 TaxID=3448126 RepID=UPI003F5BB325
MSNATYFAVGTFLALFGSQILFVDDIALNKKVSQGASPMLKLVGHFDDLGRSHVRPPKWLPTTLLACGSIFMVLGVFTPKD